VIKAIETRYAGYHFRSRLEARWAVFFDSLKIKYRYEPEGFKFGDECYLPDFYLPDLNMFAEVKPDASFDKAVRFSDAYNARKCEEMLADFEDTPLLCLQGPPGESVVKQRSYQAFWEVGCNALESVSSRNAFVIKLYTDMYGPPTSRTDKDIYWLREQFAYCVSLYFGHGIMEPRSEGFLRGGSCFGQHISIKPTTINLLWSRLPHAVQAYLAAEKVGALLPHGVSPEFSSGITPVHRVLNQSDKRIATTIRGLDPFESTYTWVAKATDVTAAVWHSRSARFD